MSYAKNYTKGYFFGHTTTNYTQHHAKPGARPFAPSYVPRFKDPSSFVEAKIKMLKKDFNIYLAEEDETWLRGFKTEGEINSAVKKLIKRAWDCK